MLQDGRDEQKPQVPTIGPVLEGDRVSSDPEPEEHKVCNIQTYNLQSGPTDIMDGLAANSG